MTGVTDRIERTIDIHAPLERVWDLLTTTGWWVSFDDQGDADRTPGAVVTRKHGDESYPVEVVKLEPMTYAAYRWASQFPNQDLADGRTTLIEFTVEELDDAVRVNVVESGFASLAASDEVKLAGLRDNSGGWTEVLANLRERATA